jgi:hypothetical protein
MEAIFTRWVCFTLASTERIVSTSRLLPHTEIGPVERGRVFHSGICGETAA